MSVTTVKERYMKDGIIRVGAASPDLRVADPEYNRRAALDIVRRAHDGGARVLVLPELSLSAYTCGELFFQNELLSRCEAELGKFAEETAGLDMLIFIGVPVLYRDKLYNCAAAVCGGRLLGLTAKTCLPNYGEFYEARYFTPAPPTGEITYAGQKTVIGTDILYRTDACPGLSVAAEICEDLWVASSPSARHAAAGANLIVNLSASDAVIGKESNRRTLVRAQSDKLKCAYIYCDAGDGESGTDMVFDGQSIVAECGSLVAENLPFPDDPLLLCEVDIQRITAERRRMTTFVTSASGYTEVWFDMTPCVTGISNPPPRYPFVPADKEKLRERCRTILNIQSTGLAGRIRRAHAGCCVIGLSGGLDSTLALIVAAMACDKLGLGREHIKAVTMPCFGTTARTKGNAERLAEIFGAELRTVDIKEAVRVHFSDIGHPEDVHDATYENAQARERTQILMDIANYEGGIVVGTGDLSELALGWATYNGDHMSMYGVNASVPKTAVRHVVAYYADAAEERGDADTASVLRDVLNTPVSPELLPPTEGGEIAQCTEDIVGPYELHDYFLFHFVKYGFTPEKIYRLAAATFDGVYDGETIRRWLTVFIRRFFSQQFKRSCLPDGPKVGSVALSPRGDWRMPSDASAAAWLSSLTRE